MSSYQASNRRKPKKSMSKRSYARKPLYPKKILNKGKFDATPDVITFMPKETRNMFPPRWRTKCVAQAYGSTSVGMGSGDYVWTFSHNNPIQPFNYTNTGLTLNNITKATYMPAGLTSLFNLNIYQFGRVYASAIELECNPQSIQDSVTAVITPNYNQGQPSTVAAGLAQPYGKEMVFSSSRSSGNSKALNVLKHYFTVPKLIGCTSQALQSDLTSSLTFGIASGPVYNFPGLSTLWAVNIETGDNTVLNDPLEVRIKITYYLELWGNGSGTQPII